MGTPMAPLDDSPPLRCMQGGSGTRSRIDGRSPHAHQRVTGPLHCGQSGRRFAAGWMGEDPIVAVSWVLAREWVQSGWMMRWRFNFWRFGVGLGLDWGGGVGLGAARVDSSFGAPRAANWRPDFDLTLPETRRSLAALPSKTTGRVGGRECACVSGLSFAFF
jgi:hypothetical protein